MAYLKNVNDNLINYKKVKKKLDFNDMINQLLLKTDLPKFKVIFIDEAQDLSPLQWKLFDKLKNYADNIYLAGDDDQAIFAWAGADVDRFINEPAKEIKHNIEKKIDLVRYFNPSIIETEMSISDYYNQNETVDFLPTDRKTIGIQLGAQDLYKYGLLRI